MPGQFYPYLFNLLYKSNGNLARFYDDNIIMISRQQHCTKQRIMYTYLTKGRLMYVCMLDIALFFFDNLANNIQQNVSVKIYRAWMFRQWSKLIAYSQLVAGFVIVYQTGHVYFIYNKSNMILSTGVRLCRGAIRHRYFEIPTIQLAYLFYITLKY